MNDVLEKFSVENGEEVRPLYDYGVGIDTHRDFIQVCVLVREGSTIKCTNRNTGQHGKA